MITLAVFELVPSIMTCILIGSLRFNFREKSLGILMTSLTLDLSSISSISDSELRYALNLKYPELAKLSINLLLS